MNSKEYAQMYRESHREGLKLYFRAYNKSRRDKNKVYQKDWYLKHQTEVKARVTSYRDSHKELIRLQNRAWHRKIRLEVLAHYSRTQTPRCTNCGVSDIDVLCIDHINGGGHEHRKIVGFANFYNYLRRNGYPEGFQVLCANCNLKKEILLRNTRFEQKR